MHNTVVLRTMAKSGAVISGSMALAFFSRRVYVSSDLNFYVPAPTFMMLVHLLHFFGYIHVPRSESETLDTFPSMLPPEYPDEEQQHIRAVYSFVNSDACLIQIIVVAWNVIDTILGFHSTIVMNMITSTHAISLYPYLSFITRRNLPIRHLGISGTEAIEKYTERGWPVAVQPASPTLQRIRLLGDRSCWLVTHSLCSRQIPFGHSWYMEISDDVDSMSIHRSIVKTSHMRTSFCVDGDIAAYIRQSDTPWYVARSFHMPSLDKSD
ncbi:hypothetical protein BDZ89DRAFT_1147063 [Hymenopellis radicata]|nr:hypothetical protein BDZ89DRAFT_1147063 [Hymenopellis radicata]